MSTHTRRWIVSAAAAGLMLAAAASPAVIGQDRGDAAAQGSMRAYRPSVPGTQLVTSAHPLASMAGAQILMQGGNAADAAVAVAAVLNVVEPQSSGIGGNGFVTYFDKASGQVHSLAMAGAAPKGLVAAEMTEETLNRGAKAATVPGNLGGLVALLDRYGSLPLKDVLAPAIRYATDGHPIHSGPGQRHRRQPGLLPEGPVERRRVPAGRQGAGGRGAVQEPRLRGDADQARRGRASRPRQEGAPARRRCGPPPTGSTRATSPRTSPASSPPTAA